MKTIKVRKASIKDLESISIVANMLWDSESEISEFLIKDYYISEDGKKELKKAIQEHIFLVAETDNKIVGFIDGYELKRPGAYKQKNGYIKRIVINPDYQRNNIGTKLMDELTEHFKKIGISMIRLDVLAENTKAINFYNNLDFKAYASTYIKTDI